MEENSNIGCVKNSLTKKSDDSKKNRHFFLAQILKIDIEFTSKINNSIKNPDMLFLFVFNFIKDLSIKNENDMICELGFRHFSAKSYFTRQNIRKYSIEISI